MLLSLARVLGAFGVRFEKEDRLVAFSGEEQGLVGSQAYARELRGASQSGTRSARKSTKVHLALQADMLAFHLPSEPMQIAFPDKLATKSATRYVQALAQTYVPELVVGYTPGEFRSCARALSLSISNALEWRFPCAALTHALDTDARDALHPPDTDSVLLGSPIVLGTRLSSYLGL